MHVIVRGYFEPDTHRVRPITTRVAPPRGRERPDLDGLWRLLDASRQHGLPITIWPTDNPWPDEQHAHGVAFETDAGIALSVKYTFGRGKRPTVTFRAWRDRDFPDAELNAMLDAMWESGEAIELLRVERTGLWASPVCL